MDCKCHASGCEKAVFENYYCEECYNELQKQKPKPKVNELELIHKAIWIN